MPDHSSLLARIPGIIHGFGDKSALLPPLLAPYSDTSPEKKQVHGTRIVEVRQPMQQCGEADGFFTRTPGILISVLTADCLPVMFSRLDGQAVGVVHAGWRGLLAGILEQMAEQICQQDQTENWIAAIGPAARACCYQVTEALIADFTQALPFPATVISPSYRQLDLAAIAEHKLRALGFHAVDRAGGCTICSLDPDPNALDKFNYTSYRRTSQRREQDPTYPTITGRHQHSGIIISG
ncbi:polyphenol oxidase family protein [Serratia microhaemolytica]|uniref:polyphenol oxidase family protein n=1 Tax=Serratia microhaemolytica TaxID=2675110 RepID=UPI000FDD4720|nr:polyphenol oxidase family protein [Serratia microhaemolytica]